MRKNKNQIKKNTGKLPEITCPVHNIIIPDNFKTIIDDGSILAKCACDVPDNKWRGRVVIHITPDKQGVING